MQGEQQLEEEHVRQVYEEIAHHFSSTRYRPWPVVAAFVQGLGPFSLGLDVGCGNGKNMLIRRHDLHCTGLDLYGVQHGQQSSHHGLDRGSC